MLTKTKRVNANGKALHKPQKQTYYIDKCGTHVGNTTFFKQRIDWSGRR